TATETVTGKKLVATQSITAGTTIDAGGNITSDDTVQGNYVKAVKKNGAGGDVTAANNVLGNNNVTAGNDVIASKEVKAGQAINTSYFTSLNNGEYLMDCNHNKLEIPLHLGNEAMICGIITNRYDLTSEDILLELPLGTRGRLFQVETMLAFRIIVSDRSYNEYILREETININSIISTLNDSNGNKIQKHKVMSDLCVGYNIAQNTVTAWESDYEYEHEQNSLLPSDFFTFEKTFLGAAKLKPKATLDSLKIEALLYKTGFIDCDYNIEYSYKINTNILGTSSIMNWAKK
ncbi:MAG TPA: hypothetical protein PLH63_02525, partial [Candidatus Cloacimonadota bacterium]|nr:hypothetical protein [Candidatus Cloacimonadota bacterium]